MRTPRFRNPWPSEEEVAAEVCRALRALGWEVHPECHGWDLLAYALPGCRSRTHRAELLEGDCLGVEVKLDAGTASGLTSLLRQAAPYPLGGLELYPARGERGRAHWRREAGPHFRAVASPRFADEAPFLRLGVATWAMARRAPVAGAGGGFEWARVRGAGAERRVAVLGPRFDVEAPPRRPELVVEVPAGVPSPRTSSAWKVAAVRLMLRMRAGELLTSRDFEEAGVSISRFRRSDWVLDSGRRRGRLHLYRAGPGTRTSPPPDRRWPEIAMALLEQGGA